jgi:hypothetical protein
MPRNLNEIVRSLYVWIQKSCKVVFMKRGRIRIRNETSTDPKHWFDLYLGYTCANAFYTAKLLLLAMLLQYFTNVTAVADVELNTVAVGPMLHDTHTTVLLVYHSGHSTVYSPDYSAFRNSTVH